MRKKEFEFVGAVHGIDKDKNQRYTLETGSRGEKSPSLGEELEIVAHSAEVYEDIKNLTPVQLLEMEKNRRYREYITKGITLESQQPTKQDISTNDITK